MNRLDITVDFMKMNLKTLSMTQNVMSVNEAEGLMQLMSSMRIFWLIMATQYGPDKFEEILEMQNASVREDAQRYWDKNGIPGEKDELGI
jgi:hypothetical protein